MNNNSCIGPLVIPILGKEEDYFYLGNEEENSTSALVLVDCISARDYFKEIYGTVQYGGISMFSIGVLIGFTYIFLSQKRVKEWTTLKMINAQLLFGAFIHVVWLSVDFLSFKKILPVVAERLFRDIPCWIILSVTLHYLSIWNEANTKALMKNNKILNHRNAYIFQAFFLSLDIANRITQQIYNDPALFSTFEAVFTIILSFGTFTLFITCNILLFQLRTLVGKSIQLKKENESAASNTIIRFYSAMQKFYFLMAPAFLLLTVLGVGIVATKVIYFPIVIAAEHLWSVAGHIFAWIPLNYILWQFSFQKKKKPTTMSASGTFSSTGNSTNTNTNTGNNRESPSSNLTNKDFRGTLSEKDQEFVLEQVGQPGSTPRPKGEEKKKSSINDLLEIENQSKTDSGVSITHEILKQKSQLMHSESDS